MSVPPQPVFLACIAGADPAALTPPCPQGQELILMAVPAPAVIGLDQGGSFLMAAGLGFVLLGLSFGVAAGALVSMLKTRL